MTLIYFFTRLNRIKCLNTSNTGFADCYISDNFEYTSIGGCAPFGSVCYTVFDAKNNPYFLKPGNDMPKLIRMYSIHFQGWKKGLMPKYCTYDKAGQIKQIEYSDLDLEKIFDIKIQRPKTQKRSPGRILSNIVEIFVPSRKLRTKIREKLVGYTPYY